jgi:Tol biopolymer transport system component
MSSVSLRDKVIILIMGIATVVAIVLGTSWYRSNTGTTGHLIFTGALSGSENWEIYMGYNDAQTNLTNNSAIDEYPIWSPSGMKILFISTRDDNTPQDIVAREYSYYTMNAGGSDQVYLADAGRVFFDSNAVWSPDDSRIAFIRDEGDRSTIYMVNADGSGYTNLISTLEGYYDEPFWSPDGASIMFIKYTRLTENNSKAEIFRMNVDGSNVIRLTELDTESYLEDLMWSPDGTRIAYTRDYEIYVLRVDASDPVNLTNSPSYDDLPVWSPDGKRILFLSNRDLHPAYSFRDHLYMMNADGSEPTRLTMGEFGLNIECYAWSPDSTRIAFIGRNQYLVSELGEIEAKGATWLTAFGIQQLRLALRCPIAWRPLH